MMVKQAGQIVVIVLLITVVALAIGLSVASRSLSEVSSSTKIEQSSRAFSAAEAGIESAIGSNQSQSLSLQNQSQASVRVTSIPISATPGQPAGLALEYTEISKEKFGQFWLADPNSLAAFYQAGKFDIYFGNCESDSSCSAKNDPPAIEVNVITNNGTSYQSNRSYFDSNSGRVALNRFNTSSCLGQGASQAFNVITNDNTIPSRFYCRVQVTGYVGTPILARVRILYSGTDQRVALQPTSGSLPIQGKIYDSTGTSGDVQRHLKLQTEDKVVPYFYDFAIFSAGDITK